MPNQFPHHLHHLLHLQLRLIGALKIEVAAIVLEEGDSDFGSSWLETCKNAFVSVPVSV